MGDSEERERMRLEIKDLIIMQTQIAELQKVNEKQDEELATLKNRMRKYDNMATKWGGFILGMVTVGVLLSSGIEKVRDKFLDMMFP